jgi:VWFA-related protein
MPLVFACAAGLFAEQPQTPAPVFRSGVDLISVDATVVNQEGNPIAGLEPADFTITVDGQPRRVVLAQYVAQRLEEASAAQAKHFSTNAGGGSTSGRLIVLVFDQEHIRSGQQQIVTAGASRFLDSLSPLDRVAVAAIPNPGVRLDFTTDRAAVRDALKRVSGRSYRTSGFFSLSLAEAISIARKDAALLREVARRECPPNDIACPRQVESEAISMAVETEQRGRLLVTTLGDLVMGLARVPGPKTLVLISGGFLHDDMHDFTRIAATAARGHITIYALHLDSGLVSAEMSKITSRTDMRLEARGLEALAGAARGGLLPILGDGKLVFDRIARELGAFYLLGFEPERNDRDGKAHEIQVTTRRPGVQVRSRRQFTFTPPPAGRSEAVILAETLTSPILATEVPLRLGAFVLRDQTTTKMKVILSAESAATGTDPVSIAYALIDAKGQVVVNGFDKKPLPYAGAIMADAGPYTAKLAVTDAAGRTGSVEHRFTASTTSAGPVEISDLILADGTRADSTRVPIELETTDSAVSAALEVYSTGMTRWDDVAARFEIAEDAQGPAAARVPLVMKPIATDARAAVGTLAIGLLPPGGYVARVAVAIEGRTTGSATRSFRIGPRQPSSESATRIRLFEPARFTLSDVLKPDVLGPFLDRLSPSIGAPLSGTIARMVAQARTGNLQESGGAPLASAGDQLAVTFIRGLELLAKNDLEGAARQFRAAVKLRSDFFPAVFYLGACYAAGGRDREAVGAWQTTLIGEADTATIYEVLADAFLRLGEGESAASILEEAQERWPGDSRFAPRLAASLVAAGKTADAMKHLDAHLERNPNELATIFQAARLLYEVISTGGAIESRDRDRARFAAYVRRYTATDGTEPVLLKLWERYLSRSS